MRWVYEWEDTQCYQMLESWSTTSAWTSQTWAQYKARLMRELSTEEYNMAQAQYQWNTPRGNDLRRRINCEL
jgi:hypothetical protein